MNPRPATIVVPSKAIAYSSTGTLYGTIYCGAAGLAQTAGTIRGSVLLAGSYAGSQTAAIRYVSSFTPTLTLTPPLDQTLEATKPDGAVAAFAGTATDVIDGALPAASIHYYVDHGTDAQREVTSGDTFPLGTTTVTMTATDRAGKTAAATFTITVVDTTPPAITAPDVTEEATGPTTAVVLLAYGTDLVDGTITDVTYTTPGGGAIDAAKFPSARQRSL